MSKDDPQLQASDFNLEKINTKQYSEILSTAIDTGSNVAVFGRRGSGKTQIAKDEIRDFKLHKDSDDNPVKIKEVYINLSVAERTDMGGYPDMFGVMRNPVEEVINSEVKRQRFVEVILPQFFRHFIEGDIPAVALLDEVDKADPSIWAPLLEIVQFKSINGLKLKNLRTCIMTGNLVSEGGVKPSLPLLDRAEKYLVEADADLWLAWAAKSGRIHPTVTAFIYDKNTELYGPVDAGDNYGDASPRGWENASQAIMHGEARGWSKELILRKVAGFVGKKAGVNYQVYFEHYQVLLPLVHKLFEGGDISGEYNNLEPAHQLLTCMIICSRLAGQMDTARRLGEEIPEATANIGRFMEKSAGAENVLISVRTQLSLNRIAKWQLDDHKDWNYVLSTINDNVDEK